MKSRSFAQKRWQPRAYDAIEAAVRNAAEQTPATHSNWCFLDLGSGNVLTFVWFGKLAEMNKRKRQFNKMLDDSLMLYSQNSKPSKVVAAIRRGVKKRRTKEARRKSSRKAARS
jgi:hypothetical protein